MTPLRASLALAPLTMAPTMAFAYGPSALGKTSDTPPAVVQEVDIVEKLGQKLPGDIAFVDWSGKKRRLVELLGEGKPVVLTLGYYRCPMLCDLVDKGLVEGIKGSGLTLGRDFRVLTLSIDPGETPMQASQKQLDTMRSLAHPGDKADWTFGVAEKDSLARLADGVGFKYAYDANTNQYAHAAVAFVLTPDGTISRYLYGIEFSPRDLRLALVEAAGGRVGTSFDRVVLSCFRWDPALRKYGFVAWGLFKVGGGLILAAFVTFFSVLWGRELRARRIARAANAEGGAR